MGSCCCTGLVHPRRCKAFETPELLTKQVCDELSLHGEPDRGMQYCTWPVLRGGLQLDARWMNICSYGQCSYYPLESPRPFTSFSCPCNLMILMQDFIMANLTGLSHILIIAVIHCCCASHTVLSVSWVCINLLLKILEAKSQSYLIKKVSCLQFSDTIKKSNKASVLNLKLV